MVTMSNIINDYRLSERNLRSIYGHRQTDRQIYTQTNGQTARQMDTQTDGQTDKSVYKQTHSQTYGQTDRQTERQMLALLDSTFMFWIIFNDCACVMIYLSIQ